VAYQWILLKKYLLLNALKTVHDITTTNTAEGTEAEEEEKKEDKKRRGCKRLFKCNN
jgi:hypothetical protein